MTRFDDLFAAAAPLISEQRHRREQPPVDGGRWPVSVLIFPDAALGERLDRLAGELAVLAGPGHFRTGTADSAHLTVRALERYRADVGADDAAVLRYARAVRAAAARVGPFPITLSGLTLTPSAVLVGVSSPGLEEYAAVLADQLGPDAWLERELGGRTFRHLTLLHFGAAIARPEDLVGWVAARRGLAVGSMLTSRVDLVRFRHRELAEDRDLPPAQAMWPEPLIEGVPLTGP